MAFETLINTPGNITLYMYNYAEVIRKENACNRAKEISEEVLHIIEDNDLLFDPKRYQVRPITWKSAETGILESCDIAIVDMNPDIPKHYYSVSQAWKDNEHGELFTIEEEDTVKDVLERISEAGYIDPSYKKYCSKISHKIR